MIVALPGLFYSLFYVYIQPIIKSLWSDFQRYVTTEHIDDFFFFFFCDISGAYRFIHQKLTAPGMTNAKYMYS